MAFPRSIAGGGSVLRAIVARKRLINPGLIWSGGVIGAIGEVGGAIAPRDRGLVVGGNGAGSGRGVPLYALQPGRSLNTNWFAEISRIGGRMAMRPYRFENV
ncbi:hypothetical protein H6G51_11820 [Limnothrix sp. FACHB-708]|uniref:hypothetical protein n=1 Tax=unclassified Limnothrix TaxID=2632864 RepID=UPI001689A080|nr:MULTISPECIES: hypothetical protein [unclassified Limnothrix]MBD2553969.1 hypothetical protein [Limnothrix sp. FACHB-708]MBD2592468.1 hypothetical protein [Limnothrix sp. FACHB-406]